VSQKDQSGHDEEKMGGAFGKKMAGDRWNPGPEKGNERHEGKTSKGGDGGGSCREIEEKPGKADHETEEGIDP
jgi:hypothetical protein